MNSRTFPNGWYVDALPTGEYVVLYPGRFLGTHLGNVALPPGEDYGPMFLKMSPTGDRFVGMGHDTPAGQPPRLFEYNFTTGSWRAFNTEFGRPVYSTNGVVLDTLPAGYGYYDTDTNLPVSRLITYGYFNGLNSWCKVGGLYIGQGSDPSRALVWDGKALRVLDVGPCQEINAHAVGESVAISYRLDGVGCKILQTSFAELRALPLVPGQPTPPPPPPPPPPPEPEPVPPERNRADVVDRIAASIPHERTLAYAWKLVRAVSWELRAEGCGLHERPASGENVVTVDGETYGASRVMYKDGDLYKLVSDAGDAGANGPQWAREEAIDPARWRAALKPDEVVEPGPVTPPTPPPVPSGTGLLDTRRLDAVIVELRAANAALVARVEDISHTLTEIVVSNAGKPTGHVAYRVALRTDNGHYLCAESGGGGLVHSDRDSVGGWETFTLEPR